MVWAIAIVAVTVGLLVGGDRSRPTARVHGRVPDAEPDGQAGTAAADATRALAREDAASRRSQR